MLQQLNRMWKVQRRDYIIYGSLILGLYLFGVVLLSLILHFSDEDSYFYMGTLMAFFGLALSSFLKHGFIGNVEFQLAVAMQQPRRHYIAADFLMSFLELAAGYIVIWALYQLERGAYHWMFPLYSEDGTSAFLFQWKFVLSAPLVIVTISQFCGAIYGRFGAKGFIGIYLGFLLLSMGAPRLVHFLQNDAQQGSFGAWLGTALADISLTAWLIFCGLVLAGMLVTAARLLAKQTVKL